MLRHLEHRDRSEWFAQIDAWKKRYPFKYLDDSAKAKPQYVIEELYKQTRRRRDHHHRRRPAPDVGRAVLSLALFPGR